MSGEANLPEYFRCAYRLLRPGGVFLYHGIGVPENYPKAKSPNFVDLYVFPDGELVPIGTMTRAAEQAGFEVRDVENLREHYALTLAPLGAQHGGTRRAARRLVDEVTYESGGCIWRARPITSAMDGWISTRRCWLKSEQGQSGLPLTRADWYQ